jgi:hypothetical protein
VAAAQQRQGRLREWLGDQDPHHRACAAAAGGCVAADPSTAVQRTGSDRKAAPGTGRDASRLVMVFSWQTRKWPARHHHRCAPPW